MKFWPKGQLIHWRWSSLTDVCEGLLEREIALRKAWNLDKLLRSPNEDEPGDANQNPDRRSHAASRSSDPGKVWVQFSEAVSSDFFWSYIRFLYLVDGQINKISSWMEACSCHGWALKTCPLKGRRCSDLATGEFSSFLRRSLEKTKNAFAACVSGVAEPEHRAALRCDFQIATDLIMTESTVKTAHWARLPYALCGLASSDAQEARHAARRCMAMYDETVQREQSEAMRNFVLAHHHPLSKRFLHNSGPERGRASGSGRVCNRCVGGGFNLFFQILLNSGLHETRAGVFRGRRCKIAA